MTENSKESQKTPQKKNVFSKIKETIDDKEEQRFLDGIKDD